MLSKVRHYIKKAELKNIYPAIFEWLSNLVHPYLKNGKFSKSKTLSRAMSYIFGLFIEHESIPYWTKICLTKFSPDKILVTKQKFRQVWRTFLPEFFINILDKIFVSKKTFVGLNFRHQVKYLSILLDEFLLDKVLRIFKQS